jgi:RNA polymerase sigma-70 factor (ECF subfamily)
MLSQESKDSARAARDQHLAGCLRRVALGDAAAFEAYYDATFSHAEVVARRYLRGDDIEDLLADVYFEVWRTAPRFDPARGSPVAWLLLLVKSRALDALRLKTTHPSVQKDEDGDDDIAAEASGDPAELLWRQQCDGRLHEALAGLSGTERWLLGLAYFRELSHNQIAAAAGMPLGTVKSLIHRAQHRLRQTLSLPDIGTRGT